MTISLFLDSNIWNFLYDRKLDLSVELPSTEFTLYITREAEFEFPTNENMKEQKQFIEETIHKHPIHTDAYFSFFNETYPMDKQRGAGFDQGRFISQDELSFIRSQSLKNRTGADRPTGLHKHEADVSLAARSFHHIVLTNDKNSTPIKDALKEGGKIIFLNDFDNSGLSLREFIMKQLEPATQVEAI